MNILFLITKINFFKTLGCLSSHFLFENTLICFCLSNSFCNKINALTSILFHYLIISCLSIFFIASKKNTRNCIFFNKCHEWSHKKFKKPFLFEKHCAIPHFHVFLPSNYLKKSTQFKCFALFKSSTFSHEKSYKLLRSTFLHFHIIINPEEMAIDR